MDLNPNAEKVLQVLAYKTVHNPNSWMQADEIQELCGFEKRGTVIGCLTQLQLRGLVEHQTQELLNGKIYKFFRLVYPLPIDVDVEISLEGLDFPELKFDYLRKI